jgi:hypothetical protein
MGFCQLIPDRYTAIGSTFLDYGHLILPAIIDAILRHAGLDPASGIRLDSGFRRNDDI